LTGDHLLHFFLHELKRLPVSSRSEGIAISSITKVMLGVPAALPHSLNQGRRDRITFNGQRMVGIGPIDFVDEAKIRFLVCWKSRRFREHREDLATHRLPEHLDAACDGSGRTARPSEYLS